MPTDTSATSIINKVPVVFSRLEDAQNVETIAKIFANGKPNFELKPTPYCVVIVGAPGVGKTTKSREIIKKELNLNYNDFYNISLDSLVERVKPYRNTTKRLYNTLKAKKLSLNQELNNSNIGLLSEVYLPTIISTNSNFTLGKTEAVKRSKISVLGNLTDDLKTDTLKTHKTHKTHKPYKSYKKSTIKNIDIKNLNDLRRDGLIYGVKNGLNIIYDTTLRVSKNIIKDDIMPILEMNKNVKYKLIIILVTAPAEIIKTRIKGRHIQMLAENDSYIRAINSRLTNMFIQDNKKGFDIAKAYFKSNLYFKDASFTFYTEDDFKFIEVENMSLNNNKNTFRYF